MGDIDDEFDEDEPEIQKVSDDTYVMDGSMDLDDIDEELDIDLESENSRDYRRTRFWTSWARSRTKKTLVKS